MTLTPDQLAEVESLASYFFSPDEIAIVVDVDVADLAEELADDESPIYRAYQKGKLKSTLELRKSIMTLAKQGSGPAQSLALRLLEDAQAYE